MSDWLQCWNPIFSRDKKLAQERFSLASFLLWFIWKARNDLMFNNKQWSPQQVISMAEKAHQEFSSVVCKPPSVSVEVEEQNFPSSHSWTPPNEPFLKINCNAAWVKNSGKGGLGVIIRDHRGILIHAYSSGTSCDSSLYAEALAIRTGLLQAAKLHLSHIVVESDCLSLIQQLNSRSFDYEIDAVDFDILQLQSSFVACLFCFIPRSSNVVADSLARSALSVESSMDWPVSTL
ncbi:uncharacterized protein LOC122650466 [Telopea speciosissima]|uniref:uncharacterized protein LOC122650466 n=1 Tax=Telopea speciosissima TaxID=54955 RepID=UPI001CC3CEBB|nr:uncharacterized protein LOC122650466 [Telopea speciosissima]